MASRQYKSSSDSEYGERTQPDLSGSNKLRWNEEVVEGWKVVLYVYQEPCGTQYHTPLPMTSSLRSLTLGHSKVLKLSSKVRLHDHAFMLLHESGKAIFEVTDEAGQLMEIERLRDYGYKEKDVLIVSQAGKHLTRMLTHLLNTEGHEVHRYRSNSEMIKSVKRFLS